MWGFIFGYYTVGGNFALLWQPGEFYLICGISFGAYLVASPSHVAKGTLKRLPLIFRGARYTKKRYTDLLCALYLLFRLAKAKGDMALESHIERPKESAIFQQYPSVLRDAAAMDFICAYIRMMTLGLKNANEIETVMDAEIDGAIHERSAYTDSVQTMADGLPAIGIVAAVLGIIKTMGIINEPPEILGKSVAGALVGTFLGVFLAYAFVGPAAKALNASSMSEVDYLRVIKACLMGHMQGYAPQIAVEFGRKNLPHESFISFEELDNLLGSLTMPQG
ncbi:MAG: flagellar motor stator protein MotA [Alphaproteobacteria bacterium]|nr:flagellar motor stator protein MotA [Alphaproteobacteria bacterium]